MHKTIQKFALALLATSAFTAGAAAQSSAPCVNDVPNPYHMVTDWAHTPRPWAATNTVTVDSHDNVWVFDRCEDKGCVGSSVAPIWELSADGKVEKNIGAGMFVFPHAISINKDGSFWIVDGRADKGKGMQVQKLSPDGKVLLSLGKAGQGGTGDDVFEQPTAVAVAPNGDIFVSEGHAPGFGNSRIVKFDKNGKFIKTFGHLGSGDGELKGPHSLAFDKAGRLFVADRSNSRIAIFDQDGKYLTSWKQFGRPSAVFIDQNDTLYVPDSESSDMPGDTYNPGCKRGIRVGSVKDGKVEYLIPPPPVSDPKLPPPEGIAADSHGTIYAAAVQAKQVTKYVKN